MENIKELRRKQIIWTNLIVIILFSILIIFNSVVHSKVYYYILLSCLILFSTVFNLLSIKYNFSLFEWSRKLQEYEREKLGKDFVRSRNISSVYSILMMCYFIWQAFLTSKNQTDFMTDQSFVNMYILLGITFLIVLNIGFYSHIRKVDRTPTVQKGYFWKQIILGLLLGLVVCVILFGFIFYYIIEI